MSLRRAFFAGLSAARRAVLFSTDEATAPAAEQRIDTDVQLGSSWVFEVRVRRDSATPSYAVIFSSSSYIDAFGLYSGFGPGGWTFFTRDATDTTNFSEFITTAAESPVGQWQTIRVSFAAGVLRCYADGELKATRQVGTFRFDPPRVLVLAYRSGGSDWKGAMDDLYLASEGTRLFSYDFNESSGPAHNAGTVGGQLDNQYFLLAREII